MTDRLKKITGYEVFLFNMAFDASRVRDFWPFDPAHSCAADRRLQRLFEGAGRIDARQAVERSLAFDEPVYKPAQTAELLRWAEQQRIVECIRRGDDRSWRCLRPGVTFIPRLSLSADARTAQSFIGGWSIDALVSREAALRARKLRTEVERHLAALRRVIDIMGASARIAPGAFEKEGWVIEYGWQLREELDVAVAGLPLYRLIQVVDAIRHETPQEDIYFSPSELDHLKL